MATKYPVRSSAHDGTIPSPKAYTKPMRCPNGVGHIVIWFGAFNRIEDGEVVAVVDDYRCLTCGEFITTVTTITKCDGE